MNEIRWNLYLPTPSRVCVPSRCLRVYSLHHILIGDVASPSGFQRSPVHAFLFFDYQPQDQFLSLCMYLQCVYRLSHRYMRLEFNYKLVEEQCRFRNKRTRYKINVSTRHCRMHIEKSENGQTGQSKLTGPISWTQLRFNSSNIYACYLHAYKLF